MTIANVTINSTFDEWRSTTNQLIVETGQAFSVAVASFNASNTVVSTAANLTSNVIIANSAYMNVIVSDVITKANIANIVAGNTIILSQIYANANTVANTTANATANALVLSSSYVNTVIAGVIATGNIANVVTANTIVLNQIYANANAVANSTANTVTNSLVLSPSYVNTVVTYVVQNGNVANIVMANTIILGQIYTNANSTANAYFANASFIYPQANTARDQANLAYSQANAAYLAANTGGVAANTANAAFNLANTVNVATIAAFGQANTANVNAITALNQANIIYAHANAAFSQANAAYNKANTGTSGGTTVTLNEDTLDITRYVAFVGASSGNVSTLNVSSSGLTFNPSSGTLSATIFNSLSDENKKENIHLIIDAMNKVDQLRGVQFNFIESGKPSAGIIAQDLVKVLPELVEEDMSVTYSGVIGLLVEAIKELNARVKELENK